MKRCSRCGETKAPDEFHRRSRSKDGLASSCKPCSSEWQRQWREANPGKSAAWNAAWKQANADRVREVERARYLRNQEDIQAAHRAWYRENVETRKLSQRAWHEANPDKDAAARARRRSRRFGGDVQNVDVDALWTGKCALCGAEIDRRLVWPDPFSKSIDHITPLALGGAHAEDNLQWAHLRCNISKGARLIGDEAVI